MLGESVVSYKTTPWGPEIPKILGGNLSQKAVKELCIRLAYERFSSYWKHERF